LDLGAPRPGRRARTRLGLRLERGVDPRHVARAAQRLPGDVAMTDFLGRLAARTVSAPTLRPRTPFRFEPVSPEEPAMEPEAPPRPRDRIVERDRDRERIITREVPVTTVITEPGETRVITHQIEPKSHVASPNKPSPPRTGEKVPK